MSRTVTEGDFFAKIAELIRRVDALERLVRAGFLTVPRTTVSNADYVVQPTDYIVAYTSLTSSHLVTLPSVSTDVGPGREIIVKDETGFAGSFNITIVATGGIDGAGSKVINTGYGVLRFYSTPSGWMTW